jgi:GDP-L-fucose synthase
VTGGAGFLGSHLVEKMRARGARDIFVPRSRDYDLTDMDAVRRMYDDADPDVVIHLAAVVGGSVPIRSTPASSFTKTS